LRAARGDLILFCQFRFARRLCAAVAVSLPVAAAAAPSYPVSARLQLAPKDHQHCLVLPGDPPDCAVVEIVRTAFAETVSRMFRQTDPPDLELVLEVRSVEIAQTAGLGLELRVRVSVVAPGGRPIDQIDSSVLVPLFAVEKGPIALALREAARQAALDFESNYREDTKVADFLVGAKVAPASAVAAEWRSDRLITLGAGGGLALDGDTPSAMVPTLNLGASWRWLFAQVSYSHYSPDFVGANAAAPTSGGANMSTSDLGLELGGVYRIVQSVELRLAPGLHFLTGDATLEGDSQSYSKVMPALYGSITKAFLPVAAGPRLVAGVEARGYFFSSVALPAFSRSAVPAAEASVGLTLAVEFPWGSKKADQR
jgi:hypothetical protein